MSIKQFFLATLFVVFPSLSISAPYSTGYGIWDEPTNLKKKAYVSHEPGPSLISNNGDDPFETGDQVYGEDFVAYGVDEYGEKILLSEEEYFCVPPTGEIGINPLYEDSHENNDSLADATNMTPFSGKTFLTHEEIQITATLTDKSSWLLHRLDVDFYMFFLRGPGLIKAKLETAADVSYRVGIYEFDVSQPYNKPEDSYLRAAKFTNGDRTSVVVSCDANSARTMYVSVSSNNDSVDGDSPYLLTVELKTHNAWFNKGEGVSLQSLMDRPGSIGALWTEQFLPEGVSPTPFGSQASGSSCLLNMYDPLLSEVRNVTSNSRACTAVFYLWDEQVKTVLTRYVQWAGNTYVSYIEGKYSQKATVSLVETASGIVMYVAGALISSLPFSLLLSGLSLANDIVMHVIDLMSSHTFTVSTLYYLGTLNGTFMNSGDRIIAIPFLYKINGSTLDWSVDNSVANAISSCDREDAGSTIIPYIRPDACFEGKISPVTALSELDSLALDRDS